MKWLGVLLPCVVLFNGVLAQQDLMERLPSCAAKCFEATLPTTKCSSSDIGCLCTDTTFMTAAAGCNALNCTVVETLKSTNETYAACGVPIRSQTAAMLGCTASIGALAVIMVIMRLVDRGISASAKLGWDDLLIALAGISSLFQNIPVLVAGATFRFGTDMWGMTPREISLSFNWLYVTYFMYQVAEGLCQLSILAFYLRLMTSRPARIAVWVLIVVVTMFMIGNTFSMALQCRPIPFFWDGWKGEMKGECTVDVRLFGFIRGGIEIVLDLAILSLPLPTLAKLQMSMRKKLQIMSMFCVGFVITVVSCLRLHALVQFDQTQNPTYDNTAGVYWCVTEANLFIVVACMPAMRAILQKALPKGIFGTSRGGVDSGYAQYGSERRQRSGAGAMPFGGITKSLDVKVYRSGGGGKGSESDVELVDRP